jgi:hypothetical protein
VNLKMAEIQSTTLNLYGLIFSIILGGLIFTLPRKYAFVPILISICFMTFGQKIFISGLNFTILRVFILLGWIRLFISKDLKKIKFNRIDKAMTFWLFCNFAIYCFREQSTEAVINRLGFIYNGFGLYFYFRYFIRDENDIKNVIKTLILLSLPLSIALLIEKISGQNIFYIFGGVPEYAWIREDVIRTQGPFGHAILAGLFGATLFPLSVWSRPWFKNRSEIAIAGMISAIIIVWCAASSVTIFSFATGISGILLWRCRKNIKVIFGGIFILIISLHFVMKAPVWYLLSKAGSLSGGTGWHRAYLIDQAINYLDEWWLIGTSNTAHWMPYGLASTPHHSDITNQYILQGIEGGLISVILFISLIVFCVKGVGKAIAEVEDERYYLKKIMWSIGCSFSVSIIAFLGVAYFDQMMMVWLLLCSIISFMSSCHEK